ncbi:MAG: exosortase A [Immundisolibacter sp.]|uniref:exosortase A n=1 Tax=Immundisolibacter sp. TaxID=1934948 RepID=UPI003EE09892
MNVETQANALGKRLVSYDWRIAGGLLAVTMVVVLLAFGDTVLGIGAIWWRSETYAHGVLVVPIAIYLLWQRRHYLAQAAPGVQPWALLPLGAAGVLWSVGSLGAVQVFQHFALYGMLLGSVWLVVGNVALRRGAFPLAFLVFAVPFGDFLIIPLQDFTTYFTVAGIRLLGVPIYRDGYDLALPSGNWRVAEVCSGLRYVIASLVLGVLYAHLMYRRRWRQGAFVVISLIVPVVANGLRAVGVIMLGHLSGMRLAVGVDHLIYGWVFFTVVMLALFLIGAVWREDGPRQSIPQSAASAVPTSSAPVQHLRLPKALSVWVLGLAMVAVWPLAVSWMEARNDHTAPVLETPQISDRRWSDLPITDWLPHFEGPRAFLTQVYLGGDGPVGLAIAYYNNQSQDSELVSWRNTLVGRGMGAWGEIDHGHRRIRLARGTVEVHETLIHKPGSRMLAWSWYWTPQGTTLSATTVKLRAALGRLVGRGDDAARVVVYVPVDRDEQHSRGSLQAFLADAWPVLDQELANAYRQAAAQ